MPFPAFGVLAALAAALGLTGLWWYERLSQEEKDRVDALTQDYAWQLYQKVVDELTRSELEHVIRLVRKKLGH